MFLLGIPKVASYLHYRISCSQKRRPIMAEIFISYTEEEFKSIIHSSIKDVIEDYSLRHTNDLPREDSDRYPDWLSVKQHAEFRGVSPSLIYKEVHNDDVPYYRKGGRIFFKKSEVLIFLNTRMIPAKRNTTQLELEERADRLSSK